jgi:hypothetical protein
VPALVLEFGNVVADDSNEGVVGTENLGTAPIEKGFLQAPLRLLSHLHDKFMVLLDPGMENLTKAVQVNKEFRPRRCIDFGKPRQDKHSTLDIAEAGEWFLNLALRGLDDGNIASNKNEQAPEDLLIEKIRPEVSELGLLVLSSTAKDIETLKKSEKNTIDTYKTKLKAKLNCNDDFAQKIIDEVLNGYTCYFANKVNYDKALSDMYNNLKAEIKLLLNDKQKNPK